MTGPDARQPVRIPTGEGFALEGLVDGAARAAWGVVVCHPHPAFGGTMKARVVAALAGALAQRGAAVLRFNFRGVGGSGGTATGGRDEDRDVAAACAFFRLRAVGELALVGYSFGGLMALEAVAHGVSVARLAALALPTGLVDGDPLRTGRVRLALTTTPTLLVAGTDDPLCPVAALRRHAAAAPDTTQVALVDGGDHLLSGDALDAAVARATAFLLAPGAAPPT